MGIGESDRGDFERRVRSPESALWYRTAITADSVTFFPEGDPLRLKASNILSLGGTAPPNVQHNTVLHTICLPCVFNETKQ
jgi:hypothetical protein